MFESPMVPRTAPVVDPDVPWEQYREIDPVGAAQDEAWFWALDRGLVPPAPDDADGHCGADGSDDADTRAPGTAAVAAAVAELPGPALAGFLAGLPPAAGVDGATV